jgi:predicted outer membrane repeat protein
MKQKNILNILASAITAIILSACSGDSGGGSSDPETSITVTGQFIDSPVQGLGYSCSSGVSGTTNSNGEYTCNVGDNVTFKIGSVIIGTVSAQTTAITPYSLFPNDITAALNLARLFQSIDTVSTDSIISIDTVKESNIPANTDFTSPSFVTTIETALAITLVSEYEAQTTMNSAILAVGGSIPTDLNYIPVANAGIDQNISTTSIVTLDGSASSDANVADTLTYAWSITSKPAASNTAFSNAVIVSPTFTADVDGAYVLSLVVNDGTVNSATDTVTINATVNLAPIANAGVNQSVNKDDNVLFDASGSSDDGSIVSYSWKEDSTILSTASSFSISSLSVGAHTIILTVTDNDATTASDTIIVTVYEIVTGIMHVANTTELRAALLAAASNGHDDTIILSDGTYKTSDDGDGTFIFLYNEDYNLTLIGSSKDNVILSGDNQHQIFKREGGSGLLIKLEQLTFMDGNMSSSPAYHNSIDYGAAVQAACDIYILDCIFKNNNANGGGGAISANTGSQLKVENSTFQNNSAGNTGGAIASSAYLTEIIQSSFTGNFSGYQIESGYGGAIATYNLTSVFNSIFSENNATYGGAIFCKSSVSQPLTVVNSIIINNNAYDGGAIYSEYTMHATNNLIALNSSGVYIDSGGSPSYTSTIYNSIFLENTNDSKYIRTYDYKVGYSNTAASFINNYLNVVSTTGTLTYTNNIFNGVTLGFVDEVSENYNLTSSSGFIDVGTTNLTGLTLPTTDLNGNARIVGVLIDIGPYEFQ